MSHVWGQFRVVVSRYQYTLVRPIYPTPAMASVAILDQFAFARITGADIAAAYGQAYLLDAHLHHVLMAWTRTPTGVEESDMLEPFRHMGVGLADSTVEVGTLGGKCPECKSVLASLPTPPDPRNPDASISA